jgi:GGDEF domain-containing protein
MHDSVSHISARDLLELAPVGIMLIRDGKVLLASRRLGEWIGRPPESLTGLSAEDAASFGLAPLFEDYRELVLSGAEGEIRLLRRRVTLPDGTEAHFFEDLTECTRLQRERNHFEELARTLNTRDPETGLLNGNAVFQALENQISRSRRYGNPLSVIRLTLKSTTEQAFPLSLKSFAQELNSELRWADQIGRLGPNSFLLVLPETQLPGAENLAAKLGRDRVSLAAAPGWKVDVAISTWQPGDDARGLLRRFGPETADG